MSNTAGPAVPVKLFIDKEKQRVLFAESDKEFVDVLFGFLTLPLGTIVRVLGKQSQVGCLDELYRSVEGLSVYHFQNKACKNMLLSPLNAAAAECGRLRVKVDDTDPKKIGICLNPNCNSNDYSSVPDAVCPSCGRGQTFKEYPLMNVHTSAGNSEDGVFVQSGLKFVTTDDLQVAPASTTLVFSLLDKFGLHKQATLEEKNVELSGNKMTSLLKRALVSKQALTGLFFDVAIAPDAVNLDQFPETSLPARPKQAESVFNPIKIKLIQTKDDASVVYAEAGQDLVDLVFSILSVPLGSIIKAYGRQWSPNGCIDNLYRSIAGSGCIKQGHQNLLLSPKLAPHFGSRINVLQVEELHRRSLDIECFTCRLEPGWHWLFCTCRPPRPATLYEMNPKSPSRVAYLKGGPRNFMVTNDLRILHFSFANTLQLLRAADIPKEKLMEKEIALDEIQVLKLLRAAIFTREALSSVLIMPNKKRRPHH